MIDSIALAELLKLPTLAHARVVGGHDGLRRPVRGVNVMEVPDILDWVKPDELLLTTAYPLRDDPVALSHHAVRANVRASANQLRHGSAMIERMLNDGTLVIVGAEYSLETGIVDFFERP